MKLDNLSVLLVDDETDFLHSLSQRLSLRNLNVLTASSGLEALDVLAREPVDVVLLDVKMPGLDGIQTLKAIKKTYPAAKVIMLTGHAELESSLDGMDLGFFDYLTKPVDINKLIAKLKEARESLPHLESVTSEPTFGEKMKRQMIEADRLASLGTMAACVAHEMNNPLAVINEATGWLKAIVANEKSIPASFRDKLHLGLDKTAASLDRARSISQGLLNFASRSKAVVKETDLCDLAGEVVELTRKGASYADVDLEIVVETEDTRAWLDPYQLRQVLLNLVTNAIQALPSGGRIGLIVSGKEDEISLRVEDDGPGIAPENVERIFEPFFTTKPDNQGTGLGLAVSRSITKELGGTLEVENRPEGGAAFTVTLPRRISGDAEQPCEGPGSQGEQATAEEPSIRVMLVDDEVDFLQTLQKRLALRKLHVLTAESGRRSLEILANESVDVVVLDVKMPEMDGIETTKEIKRAHPLVEVILLTGHADLEASLEGMSSGGFDYLLKPVPIDELVYKIQEASQKKALQEKKISNLKKTSQAQKDFSQDV